MASGTMITYITGPSAVMLNKQVILKNKQTKQNTQNRYLHPIEQIYSTHINVDKSCWYISV